MCFITTLKNNHFCGAVLNKKKKCVVIYDTARTEKRDTVFWDRMDKRSGYFLYYRTKWSVIFQKLVSYKLFCPEWHFILSTMQPDGERGRIRSNMKKCCHKGGDNLYLTNYLWVYLIGKRQKRGDLRAFLRAFFASLQHGQMGDCQGVWLQERVYMRK